MNRESQRTRLIRYLRRYVNDPRVLEAMVRVPRERFVPQAHRHLAYEDIPLPIGEGQTISQPLMVATMLAALEVKPTDKVLEVGAGSGYQAALLSLLAREVVSTERIPALAESAVPRLADLGCANVQVRQAGEVLGCPEEAPYDAIIVAAGSPILPQVLIDQLVEGGRLLIPVGSRQEQQLMKVTKTREGFYVQLLGPCRFVALVGPGAWDGEEEMGEGEG
ncbi:MAG: protein-L-isoaspartate(D-aspartate) O-methyltransferase [Chloroflexi bacterium]|nr:protein-L-isoaspartate(D-aspartate) O-methyltransferase [Chloroflexota bacterium]